MTRHKRIVATLDTGSSADWNDDHISDFEDEISFEVNFITPVITTLWDLAQTAGGSDPVNSFTDHHAFAYLNTGATTGQISSMRYEFNGAAGNITSIENAPILTTAVWLETYHTVGEVVEFGLIDSASAAAFTANQDGAYFRVDTNKIYAVTGDGAAETTTDVTPVGGISEFGHYRIELTETNAKFYIDDMDTEKATHTANLPDNDLTMKYSIQSQNNVDSKMYIDAVGLTRFRYKG